MIRVRRFVPAALALAALASAGSAHAGFTVYGIAGSNAGQQLVRFDSDTPNNVNVIGATGQTLTGIDFRPANGVLYGYNGSQLFTLDLGTGAATPGPVTAAVAGNVGFDFNPVPDRLRLVGTDDSNFRINVDDGVAAEDTDLTYAAGDPNAGANPNIVGVAYTNSTLPSPRVVPPGLGTALFDIDSTLNILARQGLVNPPGPNGGVLTTIGALGFDVSDTVGFDIVFDRGTNRAFLSSADGRGGSSSLYNVDLTTGGATLVGEIGDGLFIEGIAIAAVPEPSTVAMLAAGLLATAGASIRRRRTAR